MPLSLKKQASDLRYKRLYNLYSRLKAELEVLEKEEHELSGEIQKAIDWQKMEKILKTISKA